jgi:hypothetical protein
LPTKAAGWPAFKLTVSPDCQVEIEVTAQEIVVRIANP